MNSKSKVELAVGIFIIIGLAILVFFVFLIKDFKIIKPGYRFDVVFGFANGIKTGAPVRLSGVDVGEVKSSKFSFDKEKREPKVSIQVWVSEDAHIPVDSQVWINTLGLLGEKYIEIFPGKNVRAVKDGENILGQDPIPMEEITQEVKRLVLKFDEVLAGFDNTLKQINSGEGSLGKFIYNDAVYKNLVEFSEDIKLHPWKLLVKTKEKKK